jgi:hypothetical protein
MAYKYLNDNGLKAYTKKVKGALNDLHTPIAISTENTTESKEQNVKNIVDFVAKAKAAGIADVNGMAVTCLIDEDYSGVGYLYGNTSTTIQGVLIKDDLVENMCFGVFYNGRYSEHALVTATSDEVVNSQMLTKGARKPIILTPSTTKVDEETYQKLMSDDVDVVFKTADGVYTLTCKDEDGYHATLDLTFTCFSVEGETSENIYISGCQVNIAETTPHTCTITQFQDTNTLDGIITSYNYIQKVHLSRVLQEIDLTGTDAERKARLAKFEADWKALTGATDLSGARFVGKITNFSSGSVFTYSTKDDKYQSLAAATDKDGKITKISVGRSFGNLVAAALFSHLEPLTIKTGSAADDVKNNKFAILAYTNNLSSLGLNTSKGYQVSVVVTSDGEEYTGTLNIGTGALLSGIVTDVNENHHYPFNVSTADGAITFDANNYFLEKTSNEVTEMLDATKYSYTPVPLTATTLSNKAQLEVFLSKVPTAQVMHCTYKDVYAGTLHKINGSWYGVLVGESNTLAGQLSIKLQADGTIVEGTA